MNQTKSEEHYLLTVVIPAYNADLYIEECVRSVMAQKASFLYEVIVFDDCSTDKTNAVLSKLKGEYINLKIIRHEKNLGMSKNQYCAITYPITEFIAYIDSDDYYISTDYLERQVTLLNSNPNLSVVFGKRLLVNNFGNVITRKQRQRNQPPPVFDLHYYITYTIGITNSTMVFRSTLTKDIPVVYSNYFQFDWLLHLYHGLQGSFGFNDIVGVAYRVHDKNATNNKNLEKILLDAIRLVYDVKGFLPKDYHKYFKHPNYEMNSLSFYYLKRRKFKNFFKWYFKWLLSVELSSIKIRDELYKFKVNIL